MEFFVSGKLIVDFKRFKDLLTFEGPKQALKGISGEFRGCELTAMIGPSGSGSLLKVLSGLIKGNVSGSITTTSFDDSVST